MMTNASKILHVAFVAALTATIMTAQQTTQPHTACDAAQSQKDLSQCAGEKQDKADNRLNVVYRKILEIMQNDLSSAQAAKDNEMIKYDEDAVAKLKAAERAWIQYRDLHCEAAGHQYEGGSMRPMVQASCMEEVTLDRISELKSAYENGDHKLE
jgi:uncharacterized protein YecT (DUF1311 family)